MPAFYIQSQGHTLASALRAELERVAEEERLDTVVSCTLVHPLDEHLEIRAPTAHMVRTALLALRDKVSEARAVLAPRR
jgi:DNA-directed RNA polymerase subunit L